MSVYALSLLTNRQFLIDIKTPCNFNKLFLPNKIDWRTNKIDLKSKRIYKDCLNHHEPTLCLKGFNYLNESYSNLKNKSIIAIKTNQEWFSYYSSTPELKQKILHLGFNSTQEFQFHLLFNKWYNDLLVLTPSLQEKYDLVKKKAKITHQTQIFCAQIRLGGARPNVRFDLKINEFGVQKNFWKFVREKFLANLTEDSDWRLFVTSDVEAVELEAFKEFDEHRVIRIPGINSHVDRESNLNEDCSRIEKPILDFHFLQNCQKAIISGSGFGRIGLMNRKEPMKEAFVFTRNEYFTLEEELFSEKLFKDYFWRKVFSFLILFFIILILTSLFKFKFISKVVKRKKMTKILVLILIIFLFMIWY